MTTDNFKKIKSKKSKDKEIAILDTNLGCCYLVYYDEEKRIKKSKIFCYPRNEDNSGKRKVDRLINAEFKLWIQCLWHYGYLEEDDFQLIEFKKTLDKKK